LRGSFFCLFVTFLSLSLSRLLYICIMSNEKLTVLENAISSSGLPRSVRLHLEHQLRDYKLGKLEQTASLFSRIINTVSNYQTYPLILKSAVDACVLAVHVAFLDAGLQCLGLKPDQLVPDSWFTEENVSTEFSASYEMTQTTGWTLKFDVTFVMVGSWQLVLSANRAGSSTHLSNSTLEIDLQKVIAPSVFSSSTSTNSSAFPLRMSRADIGWEKRLQVILYPLSSFSGTDKVVGPVDDFLVKFGVKEKEKDSSTAVSSSSSSSTSSSNANSNSGRGDSNILRVPRPGHDDEGGGGGGRGDGGLMGIPFPRTGIAGDFERDMFPDVGGLRPGGLIGGGGGNLGGLGGNLVGPGNPLFNPPNGGFFGGGGLPQGVPPGARFDPFLPPGVMMPQRGGFGGVGRRGRSGGGGGGGFGPNPDHFRPPPDDDAPPDIYY
jgi:hypothetical protein